MSFWQILSLAVLGVATTVIAAFVPHADETARGIASTISNGGSMLIGAAIALATQNGGSKLLGRSPPLPPPPPDGKTPP